MDIEGTLKERGEQYGSFAMQAGIAQTLKRAVRACPNWPKLPPFVREAIDSIIVKLSRILNGNWGHVDSWHDIQGYSKLAEDQVRLPPVPPVVD